MIARRRSHIVGSSIGIWDPSLYLGRSQRSDPNPKTGTREREIEAICGFLETGRDRGATTRLACHAIHDPPRDLLAVPRQSSRLNAMGVSHEKQLMFDRLFVVYGIRIVFERVE